MENSINKQVWYKSPWLIGWLTLVLIAMAGTISLVIQASKGFPGLVVDDFYERGQSYEENIVTKLENNNRWNTEFTLSDIHVDSQSDIYFKIVDKQGKPAKVEKIILFAYRPSNAKEDFSAPMLASKKPSNNTYQATLRFKTKGQWDLLASVIIDGVEVNYAKKIFVKD